MTPYFTKKKKQAKLKVVENWEKNKVEIKIKVHRKTYRKEYI